MVFRKTFILFSLLSSAAALLSCEETETEGPRVRAAADALSSDEIESIDIRVDLPSGVALEDVALAAHDTLRVADRVVIEGEGRVLANSGTGETAVGVDATVGPVTARGSVLLQNWATVQGDVISGHSPPRRAALVRSPESSRSRR